MGKASRLPARLKLAIGENPLPLGTLGELLNKAAVSGIVELLESPIEGKSVWERQIAYLLD